MAKFTVHMRGSGSRDREVEAAGYVHEGDFFVFYDRFDATGTKGDNRTKVLTIAAMGVMRIDKAEDGKTE